MVPRIRALLNRVALSSIVVPTVAMGVVALAGVALADPLVLTKSNSPKQQAAALAYWTRARVAAAPALALQVDSGQGGIDAAALARSSATGPIGSAAPGVAAPDASQVARAFYPQDWAGSSDAQANEADIEADAPADLEAGTANVFTYYDVNVLKKLWRIYPHRWVGKLTFTTATGVASCSATAISGNNIVTAAHCVYDSTNNVWYSNWVFTPAYRNGAAPFGTFAAQTCAILGAYTGLSGSYSINTWARLDVAVCRMGNNSSGQTLNVAVGWAGRLWNADNAQLVFNSGYPARTYTDAMIADGPAQYLRSCTAETFLQTTETLGGGCYWGRGISGGSWLVSYKPLVVSGYVNSVNSGLYIGQSNLYGARFNSGNIVPLCNALGC